ncbi:hypothetical protein GCM10010517_31110 [Streptosporangium fragile]|uniref:Histidine kinase/HSP90-like ATPase domain-containing protein n=1 Tax=Streptosporangium fragile TaxID=46186 RepID=A0ABP6ICZ6_9ACTN
MSPLSRGGLAVSARGRTFSVRGRTVSARGLTVSVRGRAVSVQGRTVSVRGRAVRPAMAPRARKTSWKLPPTPASVPRGRHLIRAQLAEWELDEQVEVVELLVSELVTNALRHARGTIRLGLSVRDGLLRCTVGDEDPTPPRMRRGRDGGEGGHGLHLLALLSRRWGSARVLGGKVVWFELPGRVPPER